MEEEAFAFACAGQPLAGVLHKSAEASSVGVLVVVGGPQYRVGSHRQFVLLARDLARHGRVVLRFDYRGMGDSGGELRGFEHAREEIRAAIDELQRRVPTIRRVVLWGLCDGATAASFYAPDDPRVAGLVLLNPWVRSDATLARSLLRNYYVKRVFDVDAWRQLLARRGALKSALRSILALTSKLTKGSSAPKDIAPDGLRAPKTAQESSASEPLLVRMAAALKRFDGPLLLILSGNDITANEFKEGARSYRALRSRLAKKSVSRCSLDAADHTFSTREWRDRVAQYTREWCEREFPPHP